MDLNDIRNIGINNINNINVNNNDAPRSVIKKVEVIIIIVIVQIWQD